MTGPRDEAKSLGVRDGPRRMSCTIDRDAGSGISGGRGHGR
jgi:hypothetical protein